MRLSAGFILSFALLTAWGAGRSAEKSVPLPDFRWVAKAPQLPTPTGEVIHVRTVEELYAAADRVKPGGTICVADGHYRLPRFVDLRTNDITLRSESGQREKVILDGENSVGELVWVSRCSGVTIADLTIQNVRWNGFKINSDIGATKVTIYNCVIHNIWQRGIKGPAVPKECRATDRPSDCRVQYCLFYNDRPKTYADEPADTPQNFDGNYIGGMDIMYPLRWTISDNVFFGIQGRTREARGAVFLWHEAEDCVVERNVIVDCDCGICLGNSHRGPGTELHCLRYLVRNNFVTRCPENGILADYTHDCRILHNTIHDPRSRLRRLIRVVHDNEGLVVANNLLSGPPMRVETISALRVEGNTTCDSTELFLDPAKGNLHLRDDAIKRMGRVPRRSDVPEDIKIGRAHV